MLKKLEKFDDRYSDIYLKEANVKIEIKLKIEEDEIGDSGDFLGVHSNILEKNLHKEQDNNNNTSILFEDNSQSNSNSKYNNTHAFQKSQESPVINNQDEKKYRDEI
jgi:hypothetical protein